MTGKKLTNRNQRILTVVSSDELRDALPESGIFDMLDCEVELLCPPTAATSEIEKMVTVIESMINVTDFRVLGVPRSEDEQSYILKITNVPLEIAKRKIKG
jgi:hypothetical protein